MNDLIPLYSFQIENHIRSTEHSIMLLKTYSKNGTTDLIIQFLEKDLNHFKATVERRKEFQNV